MAKVDENQARGGRILTYKDIVSDDKTIDVSQTVDDKLKLSSRIRTIDDFTEVNSDNARKLDYWDDFPDISDADTALEYYNEDRTIVFTGTSNGLLRRGCYYKCQPDAEYSWVEPIIGSHTDIIRFDESIKGIGFLDNVFTNDAIVFKDRTTGIVQGFLYTQVENSIRYIKLAIGSTIESGTKLNVYVYSSSTDTWSRHSDVNEFMAFNHTFIDNDSAGMSVGLSKFLKVHVTTEALNSLPFDWKQIVQPAKIPMFPYDTVSPDTNNTCYLNPTSSCFFFGMLPMINGITEIKLDISNLVPKKFYGNNVVTFDTNGAMAIKFVAVYNNVNRVVNTVGSVTHAGKYKALIEVVPDDTVTVIVSQLDTTTSGGEEETSYCYGFRYNLDSSSPTVTRIELERYTDASGNIVENIKQVTGFKEMPCHDFHRCLVDSDGNARRLYKSNSLYMEDGKTYANLTGEDGDVCVEIPKTYLRITVPTQSYMASTTTGATVKADATGKMIPRCDASRYEYNGVIDYLVSTSPIPDPPRNLDGTLKSGCSRVIFNDVHPLFRVGGEPELDSSNNYQYETRYNYETDTMESTNILLRKAADACYAAAFASVRCYQSATNGTNQTLDASATATTDLRTPIGYFEDDANYPKQTCGLAMGTGYGVGDQVGEARSVAPYKNGSMVGITLPGIQVNIATKDITKPDLMPGGCSTSFTATRFRSEEPTSASTYNKYAQTLTFTQKDGSIVSKDYQVYWCDDSTQTDIYKHWVLTDGNKILSKSTDTMEESDAVDFSAIEWTVYDNDGVAYSDVTMSTANKGAKVTIGPQNYGNRNSVFDWNARSTWDTKMSYNPNWALNYRPAVSISRETFQNLHGNDAIRFADTYVVASGKFLEGISYYKKNGDTYEVASDYTVGATIPSNTYYTKEQVWKVTFASNWLTIEGIINDDVPQTKFGDNTSVDMLLGYLQQCSNGEIAQEDIVYWMSYTDSATGVAYYRTVAVTTGATLTNAYYKLQLYPNTNSGWQSGDTRYMWVEFDKTQEVPTYYGEKNFYAMSFRGNYKRYCLVKFTSTIAVENNINYYKDTILAHTDQDNNNKNFASYPWITPFIDESTRYLKFYDIGYFPRNSFGPTTDRYENYARTGIEEGVFTCDDTNVVGTNRTWYFTDSTGIQYKVEFEHASLRWKVYRRDTDWVAIYQSEPQDCCNCYWNGVSMSQNFMERRVFTHRATASSKLNSSSTIGDVYLNRTCLTEYVTAGNVERLFQFFDPAMVYASGIVSAYRKYYTRSYTTATADESKIVFTEVDLSASVGKEFGATGAPAANTYYAMFFTHDIGEKAQYGCEYYTKSTNAQGKDVFTRRPITDSEIAAGYWWEDYADAANIYVRSDYNNRVWFSTDGSWTAVAAGTVLTDNTQYFNLTTYSGTTIYTGAAVTVGSTATANKYYQPDMTGIVYKIEYITADDNRTNPAMSNNPLYYDFGDCWCIVKYENGVVADVVSSDADINVYSVGGKTGLMFRPFNNYTRNAQRTYDALTGNTTNTSVVYRATMDTYGGTYGDNTVIQFFMLFIDENGLYPEYLSQKYADALTKIQAAVASTTNCPKKNTWIIATTSNTGTSWTISAWGKINYNMYTTGSGTSTSGEHMYMGPQDRYHFFTVIPGAKDTEGVDLTNNNRVMKFKNIPIIAAKRSNARSYNCHTRLKQYMALMMVIDGGTFDTQSGISTGKSWLASFDYARSTFSGRTATMGDVSGEIIWDPDVDINIREDDWSASAKSDSTKKVVAFNWRGFENPFGNIGEYEDGIIPCTRFINGHEVTGYYECIDPMAYCDNMQLMNVYKCAPNASNGARTAIFSEYSPSSLYTWRIHAFPASGWIKRWDPVTFLPTRAGGSWATYCCGSMSPAHYYPYWQLHRGQYGATISNIFWGELRTDSYSGTLRFLGTRLQF